MQTLIDVFVCIDCKQSKSRSEFHTHKRLKNGVRKNCKKCFNEKGLVYYRNNKASFFERSKEYGQTLVGRSVALYTHAQARAKETGKSFTICRELITVLLLMGTCARTGIRFDLSKGASNTRKAFGPSLDRKDNSKGYDTENVQLVCNMYNRGKGEYDEIDFIAMCIAVAQLNQHNKQAFDRLNELRNATV